MGAAEAAVPFLDSRSSLFVAHPEFAAAKAIVSMRLHELRTELLNVLQSHSASEVNGFCKDSGQCEYIFLAYEECTFIAECLLVPQLCAAIRDLEVSGLRIARVAMSVVGSWETKGSKVHIASHASAWPGRLRLSCTLLVSEGT